MGRSVRWRTAGGRPGAAESASSRTLYPSIALTISEVHSDAASTLPWSVQTDTPALRNCTAIGMAFRLARAEARLAPQPLPQGFAAGMTLERGLRRVLFEPGRVDPTREHGALEQVDRSVRLVESRVHARQVVSDDTVVRLRLKRAFRGLRVVAALMGEPPVQSKRLGFDYAPSGQSIRTEAAPRPGLTQAPSP